jgi:nitrate reductase gamma subunit
MGVTIICLILPIFTVLFFLGGLFYRIFIWKNLAAPKMTLYPAPKTSKDRFVSLMKETFLFSSLFKADKNLWFMGWIFHAMLALIFIGHFRVLSYLPDRMLASMGMSTDAIGTMSTTAGGGAGIVVLIAVIIILLRRMMTPRVKEISSAGDYFAMLLILAVIITGDAMRFFAHFDLNQTRDYFYALITFSASAEMAPTNIWFLSHFLLAQLLIIYIPFSKILHFGGIFFTEALIQKQ